jgi:hypothetical protein
MVLNLARVQAILELVALVGTRTACLVPVWPRVQDQVAMLLLLLVLVVHQTLYLAMVVGIMLQFHLLLTMAVYRLTLAMRARTQAMEVTLAMPLAMEIPPLALVMEILNLNLAMEIPNLLLAMGLRRQPPALEIPQVLLVMVKL